MNSENNKKSKKNPKRCYRTEEYRSYRKTLRKREKDYIALLKSTIVDLEKKIHQLFLEKAHLESLVFTLKLHRTQSSLACNEDK